MNAKEPLVSVIIPVFGRNEELIKTFASLQKQTYRNLEIIVVDDGSSPPISLNNFHFNFSVSILRQENKGAPVARNTGFHASTGEYIIFLDADIITEPNMIEEMVGVLQNHPEADYAYCNFYFGKIKMAARAFDADSLKKENYINTASLIRRSAVIPWDETISRFQDWDLWLTMLEIGSKGAWISKYLFRAIPHKGGISFWLPKFAYRAPFKWIPCVRKRVLEYENAKRRVLLKHKLIPR